MNCGRLKDYQRTLEEKAKELTSTRHSSDEIAIERVPDSMDDVVLANQRELALESINREAVVLQQVSDALRRIRPGGYGVCSECEQSIAAKRLAAIPWAPLCLECQEAADRRNGAPGLNHGFLFSSAA